MKLHKELPHAYCEDGETCPAFGASVHCFEHPDFGCTGAPAACYARDDSGVHRCIRVEKTAEEREG